MKINNWSFSSLMMYESCAFRFKLAKIDRIPEPPRPPDNPLERGSRIHDKLEMFVKGEGPMDTEAKSIGRFTEAFEHLQTLYSSGKASAEDDWLFDQDWNICGRDKVWLWSKLDFNVTDEDNNVSIVGDYKTGRSIYKAVEHVQQMQLYAAATALRQEWADFIYVELWYLDEGHIKKSEYTREEALRYVRRFQDRADALYQDRAFRPNPTTMTCRWCPYRSIGAGGTGDCPVAAV